jgi:hypothetical protein
MYWQVMTEDGLDARRERLAAEERAKAARESATLDSVAIGEHQPEVEHAFAGEGTETGMHEGRRWRHGSMLQYSLDAHGEKAVDLVVTYWGGDSGRTFDILANGTLLTTQELKAEKPGEFFEKHYPIPADVLAAAANGRVMVKFVAKAWLAGGIFDLRLMKSTTPAPPSASSASATQTGHTGGTVEPVVQTTEDVSAPPKKEKGAQPTSTFEHR